MVAGNQEMGHLEEEVAENAFSDSHADCVGGGLEGADAQGGGGHERGGGGGGGGGRGGPVRTMQTAHIQTQTHIHTQTHTQTRRRERQSETEKDAGLGLRCVSRCA